MSREAVSPPENDALATYEVGTSTEGKAPKSGSLATGIISSTAAFANSGCDQPKNLSAAHEYLQTLQ